MLLFPLLPLLVQNLLPLLSRLLYGVALCFACLPLLITFRLAILTFLIA
jgi:hypothetical protein